MEWYSSGYFSGNSGYCGGGNGMVAVVVVVGMVVEWL